MTTEEDQLTALKEKLRLRKQREVREEWREKNNLDQQAKPEPTEIKAKHIILFVLFAPIFLFLLIVIVSASKEPSMSYEDKIQKNYEMCLQIHRYDSSIGDVNAYCFAKSKLHISNPPKY